MSESTQDQESIPWVEKYRPTQFDNIILDPLNRHIFQQILDKNYFPNLLFYGPPGTGKTSSIINLIQEYQTRYSKPNKSNIIHLNASDERGIDIIRNQIYSFVKSLNLFEPGIKFVVLDEVDYMTKNAQQALKYLLQTSSTNVRFCLICNYISKIDESLKSEFICMRFNQLPRRDIYNFIRDIAEKEGIVIADKEIDAIQTMYHSDIRSMINFLQLNQNFKIKSWNISVIDSEIFNTLREMFLDYSGAADPEDHIKKIVLFVHQTCVRHNMDSRHILYKLFNYIIRNFPEDATPAFLQKIDHIVHNTGAPMHDILRYLCLHHTP
jgi:DNA polymerase III delta prime subunit